ncbi:SusD/RagB family nutrient-binding outer membrane lipoprotein [Capnocytophaga canimorsus]|uniref:SusD/RagB family nutrient-binding outer membrane lipoprotein n=1 Tax=Capnocytophaga canimorsus TaxID=28188 RepID=A0A0B7IF37_9FLAO|nr:SusD/RagB family nutrient-binding outer membrane lipoprotein [Capnocytophaga canimorsus]ATA94764.1 SusD/RagB family nutrient-binding outer membrane lipoprotein [Capnocytophaga canimorsus]AWL77486.1 SusD/RagB family nutrient-binding outer membrane lipoprotein [Capnocytophaga canimorsus]AYW36039.1 SusD/RagB family nutrient-binding outer membrane lipoprotein [Capnocytophaga canimorsus]MDT9498479.1 SusD/RagB family nutrient-binding outer membrane lipoprotein [Capnocytophaga canimorsus]CEN50536.
MKMINKNILLTFGVLLGLSSCIKDFEEINTNKLLPNDEQSQLDGLASAGLFANLIQAPIPTGTGVDPANNYQVVQNMSADNWAGYFSPGRNHWDGGLNQTSFYVSDKRANGTFDALMVDIMNQYFKIKGTLHNVSAVDGKIIYTEKDEISKTMYAVARVVKVLGMHRATDLFGPIPYNDLEPGKQQAKYDTQEVVYKTFLKELDESVNQMVSFGLGNKVLEGFDPLYQGNLSKWAKLGNSLMLRLAMRVRYADENLARMYVEKAVNSSAGLIESVDDVAQLVSNGKYTLHNSLVIMDGYGELKMGATIYSYLKGYNDPRIEKYFKKGKSKGNEDFTDNYYAVRSGIDNKTGADVYENYSTPNVSTDTPTYLFKASEVYFLLAEAALAGFNSKGSVESLYKKGVELSFLENGLTQTQAQQYLQGSEKPADYVDYKNADYNQIAVSKVAKTWDDSANDEEKLEKIITQKYLAIFPNGFEAWTEWRRTGYPRMFKVPFNLSNVNAKNVTEDGKDLGMRRFPFPRKEFELNNDNVTQAKTFLEGPDDSATNVWWDKKNKK